MSAALFAVIVIVFVVVGVLYVHKTLKGAIVERLPLDQGEEILLEEEGLKLFHRLRRGAVLGAGELTHRVRAVLTDRRIFLATGGPVGEHKLVIVMILDYTTPAEPVVERGHAAYKRKFHLENGYPTYAFGVIDVDIRGQSSDSELRIDVPFPEGGPSCDPPEVKLHTKQAERYREAVARR